MPRNQTTTAQKARAAQQTGGGKYTTLLRAEEQAVLLDPNPGDPATPSWCPKCRYTFLLHSGARCPEPAVYKYGEEDFDGPHWGGGLHTHGTSYWVIARADGGRGRWLTPDMALGGPEVLKGALRLMRNGPQDQACLDDAHLTATFAAGFPGIRYLDWWPGLNEPDLDEEPATLAEGEWTWDCEQFCDENSGDW